MYDILMTERRKDCSKWDVFWYEKNIFGDIVAIYNESGTKLISYRYGAYGTCTPQLHVYSDAAYNNPFRYRGYYYDADLNLYYLNSRYYDSFTGRFISADSVVAGVGGNIKGYNLFAYCFNNPVNMTDNSGTWPSWNDIKAGFKNAVKWTTSNILQPMTNNIQVALSNVDATYSTGISLSVTPSGFVFNFQIGLSVDTDGNVAIQGSLGTGFTSGTPGLSASVYQTVTNAPSVNELTEMGYQIGGSAIPIVGIPAIVGGDFNIIPDPKNNTTYYGGTINGGLALGSPGGEFHVGFGNTFLLYDVPFNIYDTAWSVYDKIMGW